MSPLAWCPVSVLLLLASVQYAAAVTSVDIVNHWNGGFHGEACIPISKELKGWKAHLMFDQDVNSLEIWVADATKVSAREYILVNKDYNSIEHIGDKLCFTFLGHGQGDFVPTTTVYIEGMDEPGTSGDDGGNPATSPPVKTVPQTKPPSGGGDTKQAANPPSAGSDTKIPPSGDSDTKQADTKQAVPPVSVSPGSKDYASALAKSILFYDAQRSGKLPDNNPISWRGDSAVNDCVPGGWYDAGDHIKFGLPMASSSTLLTWSLIRFKDGYESAKQLDMMYDMIKWPLDYFLKAWDPNSKTLTVQVGDGNADHDYWGRPEDMTMARPCKVVNSGTKGSDIAGETAASLAAGAIAFKDKGDNQYGTELLTAAESLYAFAKSNRGVYGGCAPFYGSSGDQDEMCEAAVWLYRATGNNAYLEDAKGFAKTDPAWALSWDDKMLACQELLYEETNEAVYKDAVVGFFRDWLPGGQIAYTPCGLAWRDKWGPNRYAGNAAFMALLAAESGIETDKYRKWGAEQINYLLGDNSHDGGCYSFQIGYGQKYPQQPHHRGASCPDVPSPCNKAQLDANSPSPQLLEGALVGGPGAQDNYQDRRTDYIQNEVATDYNSGFQGALAGINHLQASGKMPKTNNKCPCRN